MTGPGSELTTLDQAKMFEPQERLGDGRGEFRAVGGSFAGRQLLGRSLGGARLCENTREQIQ
jgi:hypothetical protein